VTKSRDIDWDSVELHYRAGIRSLKSIGAEFGVTDAGIIRRAQKEGWVRDLRDRIKARTEEKLQKLNSPEKLVSEELVVESNANDQVRVSLENRDDVQRLLNLIYNLLSELEESTRNKPLFEQLGVLMEAPDEKGVDKLNEIYRKTISLPSRVKAMKDLTDALKTLIGLKRQAYGLADNANGEANSEQKAEISDTEAARRIAFVFASAMHKKEVANG
jgi:hypothetical protein